MNVRLFFPQNLSGQHDWGKCASFLKRSNAGEIVVWRGTKIAWHTKLLERRLFRGWGGRPVNDGQITECCRKLKGSERLHYLRSSIQWISVSSKFDSKFRILDGRRWAPLKRVYPKPSSTTTGGWPLQSCGWNIRESQGLNSTTVFN